MILHLIWAIADLLLISILTLGLALFAGLWILVDIVELRARKRKENGRDTD